MFDGRGKYTYENGEIKERKWYFDKYIKNNLLKLRTQIKPMNLENSIIERLIICFRHIKQAFLLEHLAKPLKNLLKSCQFVH